MADLDTRSKRASSVQGLQWSTLAPVAPDGTLDASDRAQGAHNYSGLYAAPPGGGGLVAMERSVFRRIFSRIFGRVN